MDWQLAAEQAVHRYAEAQGATGAGHGSSGQRLWVRLCASLRRDGPRTVEADDGPEPRSPGYYVDYSDWPITRSADDSSPEQAIAALRGLSDYYGAAMDSLREKPKKE